MEIEKHLEIINACRYCPMCRHKCTSGNISFHESDYPRGRGLLLDKIVKGTLKYDTDIVESLYNCSLCGCCWSHCEGDFKMHSAVEASRKDIVDMKCQPRVVNDIRELIINNKNPYFNMAVGKDTIYKTSEKNMNKKSEFLYFMGDNIKYNFHDIASKTINILKMLGLDFTILQNEPTDGKILKLMGFIKDAKKKVKEVSKLISNLGIKTVVVSDPLSYDTFINDFPFYGIKNDVKIIHTSQFFNGYIKELSLKKINKKVTIADSEFLGRFNSVFEEPRDLLRAVSDSFVEMRWNRSKALATGEAAFVFNNESFKYGDVIGNAICSEAEKVGAELIMTLSATAKKNMCKDCNSKSIKIMEVSELFWEAINNK